MRLFLNEYDKLFAFHLGEGTNSMTGLFFVLPNSVECKKGISFRYHKLLKRLG